eukprot:jgi/Ulvmu1/3320/UM155_0003.1
MAWGSHAFAASADALKHMFPNQCCLRGCSWQIPSVHLLGCQADADVIGMVPTCNEVVSAHAVTACGRARHTRAESVEMESGGCGTLCTVCGWFGQAASKMARAPRRLTVFCSSVSVPVQFDALKPCSCDRVLCRCQSTL